jgi:hypothetical protein
VQLPPQLCTQLYTQPGSQSRLVQGKKKKNSLKNNWSVFECLPSKCEALSSSPSTAKNKRKRKLQEV